MLPYVWLVDLHICVCWASTHRLALSIQPERVDGPPFRTIYKSVKVQFAEPVSQ